MGEVVDFFSRSRMSANKQAIVSLEEIQPSSDSLENSEVLTFEEAVKRNNENRDRIKKERDLANRNVLKSYRIK